MTDRPMPFPFALAVQRLNRQGLTVTAIVLELRADEAEVWEAHRRLLLPVNDSQEPTRKRMDAERAAELDRMPQKMQDHIRRSRN